MKMHKNKPMPTRDTLIITRERRPYITKGMVFHYLQVSVLGVGNGNSKRQSPWSGEGEQCSPVPLELVIITEAGETSQRHHCHRCNHLSGLQYTIKLPYRTWQPSNFQKHLKHYFQEMKLNNANNIPHHVLPGIFLDPTLTARYFPSKQPVISYIHTQRTLRLLSVPEAVTTNGHSMKKPRLLYLNKQG